MNQLAYLIEQFNDFTINHLHEDDKLTALLTIQHSFEQNKIVSAPYSFETNGKTFSCLENLLKIRVGHFIELVNCELKDDDYNNYHIISACIYREDWEKPYSEEEVIKNATMFFKSSCNFSIWGVEKYAQLIPLLKETYPILYEKSSSGASEGRKAYSMLNGLAKDEPTKWEEAKNLELWVAFAWMEEKEIQRQNEKK